MRKLMATILCAAMVTTGCASAARMPATTAPQASVVDAQAMADYVQQLPAGSKVRVERIDGTSVRGTLMRSGPAGIAVQKNTRLPEPPVEIPLRQLARVTIDSGGSSTAKAVAIGIASGVGAFFAIVAIVFAVSGD